jgi:hypothetical protein
MARLMQRQPDHRLANILWVMSGDETVLGAIDASDGLNAPGGGISNGGLGSDSGVLSTYDRGGALAAGVSVQDMGSSILGGAMGCGGIRISGGGLWRIIRGARIQGSLNGLLLGDQSIRGSDTSPGNGGGHIVLCKDRQQPGRAGRLRPLRGRLSHTLARRHHTNRSGGRLGSKHWHDRQHRPNATAAHTPPRGGPRHGGCSDHFDNPG